MPKQIIYTPQLILDELVCELEQRERFDLSERLKAAGTLLPIMAQPQYERCVEDVLAGAVATIIHEFCYAKNFVPIVVVCETGEKKRDTAHLKMIIGTLQQMNYLEKFEFVSKEPVHRYLCLKRLRNAEANGNEFPARLARSLLITGVDKKTAGKVCVTTCSKGCTYRGVCKYQILMENISDGQIPLLVYNTQQYQSALKASKLPKARLTVCSPTNSRALLGDGIRSIRAKDIEKLLLQSERLCSSARQKRIAVLQETQAIRKSCKTLFGMAENGIDEQVARLLLASIHGGLLRIRRLCIKEMTLWGNERARWNKNLNRTISDIEALQKSPFTIVNGSLRTTL